MNKKFCAFIACVIILACSCAAGAEGLKLGLLQNAGMSEKGFNDLSTVNSIWKWEISGAKYSSYHFYDDLNTMLMALNAGNIDDLELPQPAAEYILSVNPNYKISGVSCSTGANLVFGFLAGKGVIMQKNFNYALGLMRRDGTLQDLQTKYLANPGKNEPESVKFESFPNAEKIKIAVTGDIPPIDYTSHDGKAAGFNAAVIAEIAKRLQINVEIFDIDTNARTAALTSGRADAVFWYELIDGAGTQYDAPEGVIFSDPYYRFDLFVRIGLRKN